MWGEFQGDAGVFWCKKPKLLPHHWRLYTSNGYGKRQSTESLNANITHGAAYTQMDAKEFLHKMHTGDATVWDELMPMLRRIALGACHDLGVRDELKHDIVQDVAMRVFTHWQSYAAKSTLSTWIYSIARNRCRDELRKRVVRGDNRKPGDDSDDNMSDTVSLNQRHDPKLELMLCVQQVLAELETQGPARKNSRRMIEVLIYWVEHSPSSEELANFLNTSVQAAKQRKYEIRKHLEELCRRFCGNDDCSLQFNGGPA